MGWMETYYNEKLTQKEKREKMDALHTFKHDGYEHSVLYSTIKNNVYYAAVQKYDLENDRLEYITASVCLLSQRKDGPGYWFGYKAMTESAGPYYYDCPDKILDVLTPTDDELSNLWREKCRALNKMPKLANLKENSVIQFVCGFDTNYHKKGDLITLEKHCTRHNYSDRGRKSYRWIERSNTYANRVYWPAKLIPKKFDIIYQA